MKNYTLKADDLAAIFKVSHKTIMNWFNKEGLPGVKIAGVFRFNQEEVEAWLQNKKGPTN